MQIRFSGTQAQLPEELCAFATSFSMRSLADMSVPREHIAIIHFASEETYGKAIQEIDPEESHSDNAQFTGVGKALRTRAENGEVVGSIVLRLELMHGIWTQTLASPDRSQWAPMTHLMAYMLYHEVGHCVDYRARPREASESFYEPERGFEISRLARYYARIIESEFAACVHSASGLSPEGHAETIRSFLGESLMAARREADLQRQRWESIVYDWDHMALSVAASFWNILSQFGKIVGSCIGNPALSREDLPLDDIPDAEEIRIVLNEFGDRLTEHWKAYPEWSSEVPAFMLEAWDKLAKIDEFFFFEGEDGSELQFEPPAASDPAS